MKNKVFWFIFLTLFLAEPILAQEQLIGLSQNKMLQDKIHFKTTSESNVFLPFFDDFKPTQSIPNQQLWTDEFVFVNTGFQKFPPNLGVATFDALDQYGTIYEQANSFGFLADFLTSQAIRLDSLKNENRPILISDSVYFSFYYQPQGTANAPESSDSLVLEFYSGRDQLWYPVWSEGGMPLDSFYLINQSYFKQILIPITDSARFFHSNFRFRFYNYASLANTVQNSWQSNADQWNIDYVKLDVNRTRNDIYSEDLVFVNMPPSFLKKYRSIPYDQYKNDPTNSMADSLHSVFISNLSPTTYTAEYSYVISDQLQQDSVYSGGSVQINPFSEEGYSQYPRFKDPKVISFFALHPESSKEFTIRHTVNTLFSQNEIQKGDTLIQKQIFADYFAYDDGNSEAGYGLSGNGNSAALRFKLNTADTLTSVQIYFNPTLLGNEDYFYLRIWTSLSPEILAYEKLVQVSRADTELGFCTYSLDRTIVLSNEFYVGFTQTTESNLNVGFDLSFSPEESLFYNAGNGWEQSVFSGALMIRPAFSKTIKSIDSSQLMNDTAIQIYPNPLKSGSLSLIIENGEDYFIRVYDLMGKLVYSSPYQQQLVLDFLKNGIYLIRFQNLVTGDRSSQKLIISK